MVSLFAAHAALAGKRVLSASASSVFPVDMVITLSVLLYRIVITAQPGWPGK
jgi:hypothetical protein